MTGFYIRVKRDGVYQNVEVDQLTDAEMHLVMENRPAEELLRWVKCLAGRIRENVKAHSER